MDKAFDKTGRIADAGFLSQIKQRCLLQICRVYQFRITQYFKCFLISDQLTVTDNQSPLGIFRCMSWVIRMIV